VCELLFHAVHFAQIAQELIAHLCVLFVVVDLRWRKSFFLIILNAHQRVLIGVVYDWLWLWRWYWWKRFALRIRSDFKIVGRKRVDDNKRTCERM
jgi:hypothetical protein